MHTFIGSQVNGWVPGFIHTLEGLALTTTVGKRHTVMRKELFSLFTTNSLRMYFPNMRAVIQRHIRKWMATGSPLQMTPLIRDMAFAVVYGW